MTTLAASDMLRCGIRELLDRFSRKDYYLSRSLRRALHDPQPIVIAPKGGGKTTLLQLFTEPRYHCYRYVKNVSNDDIVSFGAAVCNDGFRHADIERFISCRGALDCCAQDQDTFTPESPWAWAWLAAVVNSLYPAASLAVASRGRARLAAIIAQRHCHNDATNVRDVLVFDELGRFAMTAARTWVRRWAVNDSVCKVYREIFCGAFQCGAYLRQFSSIEVKVLLLPEVRELQSFGELQQLLRDDATITLDWGPIDSLLLLFHAIANTNQAGAGFRKQSEEISKIRWIPANGSLTGRQPLRPASLNKWEFLMPADLCLAEVKKVANWLGANVMIHAESQMTPGGFLNALAMNLGDS